MGNRSIGGEASGLTLPQVRAKVDDAFREVDGRKMKKVVPDKPPSYSRVGTFELDRTPENALPLSTAQGERLWISHWDPHILKGDGFQRGSVFVTINHGRATYWTVLDYDTEAKCVSYSRVTPGADMGMVEVEIEPNGEGGSKVMVQYTLTSLSEGGNEQLREFFDEKNYAKMMTQWRTMILESKAKIDQHFSSS